ncbi:MurR/RpiR family transcriptional regulator [Paenarthrobacter sp. NCHU4564]|uniref:MurR/RpiR family transcriptional regulator n=1 Tax=Paenarthrobacter sp. NCHU4564 TaxID=3451353 RepID=UPI003F9657D3
MWAQLRSSMPLLGPSERRVIDTVLRNSGDVAEWSTGELASAAETSAATVVRACQTVGFRGFQHLRLEIARATPSIQSQIGEGDPTLQVFSDAADAVLVAKDSLNIATLNATVLAIAGAQRLVLVGSGFSGPPLQDAAMRFATVGRSAEAPSDVLAQQFAASSLTANDVCLAVSYSGANVHTLHACRAAADGGAQVIAITSFERSPLTRLATMSLITGQVRRAHDVDPFLSRLGHQLVLHALHLGLAARTRSGTEQMREVVADALITGDE